MTVPQNRKIIYHGGHDSNDASIRLKAGKLNMFFENGSLRNISMGSHELVRMIYMAVRAPGWITVKPEISGEEFGIFSDSFIIRYVATYSLGEIRFFARFMIEGGSDSSLKISFEGKAQESFMKNRIGFCVLHPIHEVAGRECIIGTPDQGSYTAKFPELISPHQPFSEIKSMQWTVESISCRLAFSGDVFETEDQRNWTDASFKTYSTPLRIPFPAKVNKGDRITQSVSFQTTGRIGESIKTRKNVITLIPEINRSLPSIGIGRTTRSQQLTSNEKAILKQLKFDHYRVDLHLFEKNWKSVAKKAFSESVVLGYSIEAVLFFDDKFIQQADEFISLAKTSKAHFSALILLHKASRTTPDHVTDTITPLLRAALPGAVIGAGTNCNFAQLNRQTPVSSIIDMLSYSIHPQEHASDNLTLAENLEAQRYTVESAKHLAHGMDVWVSPVTIQRRFNANAGNYEEEHTGKGCPPQVDSRLMSLFGAGWTAISLKYLCEAGIKGVTYHQTVGERGILQGDYPSEWPEFPATQFMLFPVFHIFIFILKSKEFRIIASKSTDLPGVDILSLSDGTRFRLLLVNFNSDRKEAMIQGELKNMTVIQLNAESYIESCTDPLWLKKTKPVKVHEGEKILMEPYSISFIECTTKKKIEYIP